MKKSHLAIATMFLLGTSSAFAFDPPRSTQRGNGNQGRGNGQMTGPRDGSGPIHQPGTGGGTGAGGNGKMTGPRDGSGPIHQPGTGGGTGAGQRRGRR